MRKYIIKNELLDAPLCLVIGPEPAFTKLLNKIDTRKNAWENNVNEDTLGEFVKLTKTKNDHPRRLIWLKQFRNTVDDRAVLVHEIQHYVNNVCLDKGIKHTRGDEETSAYLMEYMYKNCFKALKVKA